MSVDEKFEAFKDNMISENEAKYGEAARRLYGDAAIDKGNQQFKNVTREQYQEFEDLCGRQFEALAAAMDGGDPTSDLAMETAPYGITVNAIAPALIATEMVTGNLTVTPDLVPVGRFGLAQEVAEVIVMLAQNGYITGQTINVNGGWYMS